MYRNCYLLCLVFLFSGVASFAQVTSARQKINFDNNWKFHFGHTANAEKDFNYTIANIFSKSGAAQKRLLMQDLMIVNGKY